MDSCIDSNERRWGFRRIDVMRLAAAAVLEIVISGLPDVFVMRRCAGDNVHLVGAPRRVICEHCGGVYVKALPWMLGARHSHVPLRRLL